MLRHRPERTPCEASGLPGRRRVSAWGAAALGVGLFAVAVHDARQIRRVRRAGPADPTPLVHAAVVGEGPGEVLDLVVLGDSAAAGYGNADAREAFPHQLATRLAVALGGRVRVDAVARSGARTTDVAAAQVPLLHGRPVDVVVISVGVNDAIGRRRVRQVRGDTRALLDAVRAVVPGAAVVLVGCPDLSSAPGLPWPLDRLVGWRCRRVRAGQAATAAATGIPFVAPPEPPDRAMFGPDGLHPGPAGQAAAAAAVAPAAADAVRHARPRQEHAWTSA